MINKELAPFKLKPDFTNFNVSSRTQGSSDSLNLLSVSCVFLLVNVIILSSLLTLFKYSFNISSSTFNCATTAIFSPFRNTHRSIISVALRIFVEGVARSKMGFLRLRTLASDVSLSSKFLSPSYCSCLIMLICITINYKYISLCLDSYT